MAVEKTLGKLQGMNFLMVTEILKISIFCKEGLKNLHKTRVCEANESKARVFYGVKNGS